MVVVNSPARARAAAQQLGNLDAQLAALAQMTVPELVAKYLELYGEPTRSKNKDYLRKRLSWRIQELAEGGLSKSTLQLITTISDELPEAWRQRVRALAPTRIDDRGKRLPPVGTTLTRAYRGTEHLVTICKDGFEFQGKQYRSLSAVAKQITGSQWNGFTFFGLAQPDEDAP
jgi:hypothetical protein